MPLTDLTVAECHDYRPDLAAPADLDEFWSRTLHAAGVAAGPAEFAPVDTGLHAVRTFDVTVRGHAGQPVRGWLQLPAAATGPLGCVVEFAGYGRGRALPHQHLFWASAGYAHLIMDTRGQGWTTGMSATPDPDDAVAVVPGHLTKGLDSPDAYYYRRVYADAVRCVLAARDHPEVDPARVAVAGVSQGGGIALAVAGLLPGLAAVLTDVPFLCHFRRGVDIAGAGPYLEIAEYLRVNRTRTSAAFRTLAYFDAAILGASADAPALFSIAMMDDVCPPSTGFAAYHRYGGAKDLRVYEFNGHEGGAEHHQLEQLAWLRELM